ncbi:ROK family transcriptional regulator [Lichenifustis flavocetrariae]|uniref:ROK family transcriptional regulator n=1 Tax=Lichenifustis flavocetrariae TaxID=2949735 RepID=A0AA42CLK7_9HYPH|nr:ROK family transcriptional regulator [Lichenifustis flavocetrariae]MCW6507472.1 ROK family transcriptional regulator [Lichenifustis flavocetrariae]
MKTADPELMRAINRFHVMDAVRRFGPIARVEISTRTELSPTTVSAITAALLEDGLIVPRQMGDLRDAARGRPRVLLELNPEAAQVVGVKLAPDRITVVLTNFRADVLAQLALPIRLSRQAAAVVADLVEDGIRQCVADAGCPLENVRGICVGLPGVVEHGAGICRQSPVFTESDVPFATELSRRLQRPVSIDSDANLVALAESWFGAARGLDDFLVVSVEHSLGLGIMHKGELFRGAGGLSPDLGDMLVRPAGRTDGTRLADIASEAALLIEAQAVLTAPEDQQLFRAGRGLGRVLALAEAGDARMTGLLGEAGEALGFAIANLIALFAPPKVILAGALIQEGAPLLDALLRTVAALLPPSLAGVAEIVTHRSTDTIWARGAAAMTLQELYGAPWNTTGPALRA